MLLLGFAGCDFDPGVPPVVQPPPPTLVFRATVPTALTVLAIDSNHAPGVQFIWKRPGGIEESQIVSAFTAGMDGVTHVKVYELNIATPGVGMWTGGCAMAVREGSATADGISVGNHFMPDFAAMPHTAVLFRGEGSPQANHFAVVYVNLVPA